MICICRLDVEANASNLREIITNQLQYYGGISDDELVEKLIRFGADGDAIFQG